MIFIVNHKEVISQKPRMSKCVNPTGIHQRAVFQLLSVYHVRIRIPTERYINRSQF